MRFEPHSNPQTFQQIALPLLIEREAESCVIFGVLSRLLGSECSPPGGLMPLMATAVTESGRCIAALTKTQNYPIVLTAVDVQAAALSARELHNAGAGINGVVGATDCSAAFATAWVERTGLQSRVDTRLGLYQTDRVIAPPTCAGSFRSASSSDFDRLLDFAKRFYEDIREPTPNPREPLTRAIDERRLHVWCDEAGQIVSMAAWAGPTPNGVRVNFVYTPPELRGRGYASNCVAALTQKLLTSGRRFVFLFTDLDNPISNRIYQRIGYRHVADQQKILFEPATAK